ncbi:peptidase family M48 protein [Tanacetum coccineum]|uniref:Peptidase family M48 protein n=1 Tax=Tanacetum coccineum TaxID=301880 RepID=A0ABQ5IE41_9ASTR
MGEITITLEDMMVLGGFSVFGDPVTSHVESLQDRDALLNLDKAYKKLTRVPFKKAGFHAWMSEFKNNKNVHEHEAFIALWLCKPDGMCNIRDDETRLARWAKSVNKSTDYAALESGTCREHFVWRPYVKDTKHFIVGTIYKEDAQVEKIDNQELDSFARGEYYTSMKCVWEELDSMNEFLRITNITHEIVVFLNALKTQKEEQRLLQFVNVLDDHFSTQRSQLLLNSPLPSVEIACALLQHEESQRGVFRS